MNDSPYSANAIPRPQFCALEYRPEQHEQASQSAGFVILLAVKDEAGGLSFLVHPDLRKYVREEDRDYLDSLLEDFSERAKLDSEALFQQLCSLAVGPLIPCQVGELLAEYPQLMELSARFVLV